MKVLVLGWYGSAVNIGDNAFKPAFQQVLGESVALTFTDVLTTDANQYDAVVVGGGSFLDQPLNTTITPGELKVPLGFIGVGMHGVVHEHTQPWLDKAEVIVSRNNVQQPRVLLGPDLVFARTVKGSVDVRKNHALVLLNGFHAPQTDLSDWQVNGWNIFVEGISQSLNALLASGWTVEFQPMCTGPGTSITVPHDDRLPAALVATKLSGEYEVGVTPLTEGAFARKVAEADLVISSRFHGCVFATILGRPFVGISAHDKFTAFFQDNDWTNWVDFYEFDTTRFREALEEVPSAANMERIVTEGRARWQQLSVVIRERLGLTP